MGLDGLDTPLVRDYLEGFAEIVRLVVADQDVPESVWDRLRDDWAAMTPSERVLVEHRTRRMP